jgi:hypothetical protein
LVLVLGLALGSIAVVRWYSIPKTQEPLILEARDGIEPSMKVLQTFALPLGYRALEQTILTKTKNPR